MELDARGHGYDGKLHADRWTAEYVGRGNHALDAACFRSTRAVSGRTRTAATPPPPLPPRAAQGSGGGSAHRRTTEAAVRTLRVFYYEVQVLSTGEGDARPTDEDPGALDARQILARRAQAMGLPPTALPARAAAGHPYSAAARGSWRERARQLVQARVQDVEAASARSMGSDASPASNGAAARSEESDVAMEGEALAAERAASGRSVWRLYQGSSSSGNGNGGGARASPWLESEDENDADMRYYQVLARSTSSSSSTRGTGVPSAISSGVHFAFTLSSRTQPQQHLRPRYERRRMRRDLEKKRFDHRVAVGFSVGQLPLKVNARAGRGLSDEAHLRADDEKIPLGHPDLGQSARSLAYVGKTGRVVSNGTQYLECDKYGAGDVVGCGILFDSKTFFFTLNGKLMGMVPATDVHHLDLAVDDEDGEDDAQDCVAVEFDRYELEADARSDCDGSDMDDDGDDETMSDADSSAAEEKELYPSVSLHRAGECVRTVFAPTEFKFDLFSFQKQVLKERQRSLGSDALPGVQSKQQEDDAVMDALVLDYFKHCGYEGAFKALRGSMQATASSSNDAAGPKTNGFHDVSHDHGSIDASSSDSVDEAERSLPVRGEVRRCVRCFETARALETIERLPYFTTLQSTPRYQRVLLYCHMLCVLDVAQPRSSKSSNTVSPSSQPVNGGSQWQAEKAIAIAQSVFADYIDASGRQPPSGADIEGNSALRDDLALFMSVLLHDDPSQLPTDSRARQFLTSSFRERVADELNSILLSAEARGGACASVSSLETFLDDLDALRATSLRHGCRVFPESAASLSAQLSASRRHKEQQRRARADDVDADLDLSSGSDDSSSSASSRSGRQRIDDDEEEEEEE